MMHGLCLTPQGVSVNPLDSLMIHGRGAKLHKNAEQAAAVERGDTLLPWNGRDGRWLGGTGLGDSGTPVY